jgi:hypothetical protein
MNYTRKHLLLGLGVAALLAAPRVASAEVSFNLRKAYTGTAGGNNYLDAGYRIEYGVSAGKSGTYQSVIADTRSNSWVKLFGRQFDATSVRAAHTGTVNGGCNANLAYETYLVGIKIPTLSGSIAGGWYNRKNVISRQQALTPKISVDFARVGPVTVGFDVKTTATEFVRLNGTVWCNQINAELRPGAVLSISAAFRVDAVIAAAGIRGVLTLMDSSLPVVANVGWQGTTQSDFFSGGSYCTWQLSSYASANLEIIPVSGRFEAFLRVGLPCLNVLGILPGDGLCLSEEFKQTFWNYTAAKKVWPLEGRPLEHKIADGTANCGPAIPNPPARS